MDCISECIFVLKQQIQFDQAMQNKSVTGKKYLQNKKNLRKDILFLTATTGDLKGEIDLSWEPVKGASSYILQRSTYQSKPAKWKYEDIVSKSSCTVSNLRSNNIYWFRVAAATSQGKTNWSIPVKKKAP